MFLHYCRMVQTEAAIALVKGLWRQGLEPSPMLLTSLPALGGEAGLELRRWLSIWFHAACPGLGKYCPVRNSS